MIYRITLLFTIVLRVRVWGPCIFCSRCLGESDLFWRRSIHSYRCSCSLVRRCIVFPALPQPTICFLRFASFFCWVVGCSESRVSHTGSPWWVPSLVPSRLIFVICCRCWVILPLPLLFRVLPSFSLFRTMSSNFPLFPFSSHYLALIRASCSYVRLPSTFS